MRVLYVTHYSIMEPLGQSQILPYLKGLAGRGYSIEIISFEKPALLADRERVRAQTEILQSSGIGWVPRVYRRGASIRHFLADAAGAALEINRRYRNLRVELVHCRAHVPFLMAWYASSLHRLPVLFDFRGFMAEEYVDAGLWRAGGVKFRLAKLLERKMSSSCAALVVLTHPMREYIERAYGISSRKIFVIPCCVDLARFAPKESVRRHPQGGPLKVVYSGSTDGRYDLEAMLRFFALLRQKRPASQFTILSTGDIARVQSTVAASPVPADAVTVRCVDHNEVPAILAEHDVGLFFLRGNLTLLAASPTKIGEYLACGLSVVAEKGIGGLEEIVVGEGVGHLVGSAAPADWNAAADEAIRLCDQPDRGLKAARTAAKYYSLSQGIETYAQAYEYAALSGRQGQPG